MWREDSSFASLKVRPPLMNLSWYQPYQHSVKFSMIATYPLNQVIDSTYILKGFTV